MGRKQKMTRNQKIALLGVTVSVLAIIVYIILALTLTNLTIASDVVEFGLVADLDPTVHKTPTTKAIFDIDTATDNDHTTYRIIINNVDIERDDSSAFIMIRIFQDSSSNVIKQWDYRDGEQLNLMYSGNQLVWHESHDIEADTSANYYCLFIFLKEDNGQAFAFQKYWAYEETVPPFEPPVVEEDSKTVTITESMVEVSFSVDHYESVTSIFASFTIDGEEVVDVNDNLITFDFTHAGDGLYEGSIDRNTLPQEDMFLNLDVLYDDDNNVEQSFVKEGFAEVHLAGVPEPIIPEIDHESLQVEWITNTSLSCQFIFVSDWSTVTGVYLSFRRGDNFVETTSGDIYYVEMSHEGGGNYTIVIDTSVFTPEDEGYFLDVDLLVRFTNEVGEDASLTSEDFFSFEIMEDGGGTIVIPTKVISIPLVVSFISIGIISLFIIIKKKLTTKGEKRKR